MDMQKAREMLKALDRKIHFFHPPSRYAVGYNQIFEPLTEEEWTQVKEAVLEHEFPLELQGTPYGFALAVRDRQDYLQGEPSETLLYVEHSQFPCSVTVDRVGGQVGTLRALESLVYRPRNHELLAWYGMEPLRADITHFAY